MSSSFRDIRLVALLIGWPTYISCTKPQLQFPFQFHKRKSVIAPFLHFSTLFANRKLEITEWFLISDLRSLHYRYTSTLRRWNSPLVQAVLPVRVCTSSYICIHCLLFLRAIDFKIWSFIYLFIRLLIYLCIYLSINLFICLFIYLVFCFLVFCFCPGRATFTYVYVACCFMGY